MRQVQIIGIAWYREAEYDQVRRLMLDGSKLPRTYGEWSIAAQRAKETAKTAGAVPVEAYIDPATFVDWCRAHGHQADAQGRMAWANSVAAKMYQSGNA